MLLILSILAGVSAMQSSAGMAHAPQPSLPCDADINEMELEEVLEPNHGLFPDFRYDRESMTFRIPKSDGFSLDIDEVEHNELYHQRQYILSLSVSDPLYLGYGNMIINDDVFRSVTIAPSEYGYIKLTFNYRQIIVFDVSEDEYYYIIRAMHPRERYSHIVVIDPGHGGHLPGAVHGGVRESDLNLAVTRYLIELIEKDGYIRAYTTRNSDVHVCLWSRARFGNEVGDMFISIHHNASTNRNIHGTEAFYFHRPPGVCITHIMEPDEYCDEYCHRVDDIAYAAFGHSRDLSDIMRQQMTDQLSTRDRGSHNRRFVVLRYSRIPATLVELGFMSNAAELARMRTGEFQRQAAQALYDGLLEAFELMPPSR